MATGRLTQVEWLSSWGVDETLARGAHASRPQAE
jgi:hypothetical protein